MIIKPTILIILSVLSMEVFCMTDSADTAKNNVILEPYHRNVIKFNPTPMLLFGEVRNVTFSYERMITKNQSVAVQLGYLTCPDIFNDTIANIIKFTGGAKQEGVNLAFDYRYYPSLRNRRPAPDGLYIGGYVSYYGFHFDNSADILGTGVDQFIKMTDNMNIVSLGFDLGYQFVFWKKLTLDLLMFGPSLRYTYSMGEISGDLDLNHDQIGAIDDEMAQKVMDRFPFLTQIFSEENISFNGSRTTFTTGFRYSIQIGFHF
jgi:hypothetical protein